MAAPWETPSAAPQPAQAAAPWETSPDAKQADPNAGTDMRQGTLMQQLPSGINSALTGALDIPGNLASAGLNAVGVTPDQSGIQPDYFKNLGKQTGMISPGNDSLVGQGLRQAGEFVGSVPVVAAGGGALQGLEGTAGKIAGGMVPRTAGAAAAEAGTAAAAGGSSAYAGDVGEQAGKSMGVNPEVTRKIFELGDAITVGSLQSIARGAYNLGKGAVSAVSPNLTREGAAAVANKTVQSALSPALASAEAQTGLDTAKSVEQRIPGTNYSTAEATGDKNLLKLQGTVQKTMSPEAQQAQAARKADNIKAVTNFIGNQRPDGSPISTVYNVAKRTFTTLADHIESAMTKLPGQLQRLSPEQLAAQGASLRTKLKTIRDGVAASYTPKFDAIKADPTTLTSYYSKWAQQAKQDWQTSTSLAKGAVPTELKPLFQDAEKFAAYEAKGQIPKSITIKDLMARRQQLSDAWASATTGANPDFNAARILGNQVKSMDTFLDGLPLGQQWKDLRAAYKADYVDRFENNTAFKIDQKAGRGHFQVMPERVASLGIDTDTNGGYSKALQFRQAYGSDPEALQHMTASASDDFYNAAIKDGKIDPKAAQKWQDSHRGLLSVYPEAVPNAAKIMQRQMTLEARATALGNDTLGKQISKVTAGTTTVDDFMNNAVNNDALGTQLWKSVKGDPQAEAAFRRHLFDQASDAQSLDDFLAKPVAKAALSPQHIADLKTIFNAKQMNARIPSVDPDVSVDPFKIMKDVSGLSAASVLSRGYGLARQVISPQWVLSELGIRAFQQMRGSATGKLLEEALYNPDVARSLVQGIKQGNRNGFKPEWNAPIRNWLVWYGLQGPEAPNDYNKKSIK